jgi:Transposase, Mutator family
MQPGHKVPKSAQPWMATLVRTIFEQPDAASVHAQHVQVVAALEAKVPAVAAQLDEALEQWTSRRTGGMYRVSSGRQDQAARARILCTHGVMVPISVLSAGLILAIRQ